MKKIIIVFGLLLAMVISIDAQTAKKSKNSSKKSDVGKLSSDSSQSLAISNDSCRKNDDSCRGKQWGKRNGMCRMKDKFIDKDGDGINDNRCKGLGLGWKKRNKIIK
jgi:hypothetical protein